MFSEGTRGVDSVVLLLVLRGTIYLILLDKRIIYFYEKIIMI